MAKNEKKFDDTPKDSVDETQKVPQPDSKEFYEAMPGTMDQTMPKMFKKDSGDSAGGSMDRRPLLALLLIPLAIVGGMAIINKRRGMNKPSESGSSTSEP